MRRSLNRPPRPYETLILPALFNVFHIYSQQLPYPHFAHLGLTTAVGMNEHHCPPYPFGCDLIP